MNSAKIVVMPGLLGFLTVYGVSATVGAKYAAASCSLPTKPQTLFYLSPSEVSEFNATAEDCCSLCAAAVHGRCETW
jgi:hypothetical protein